jgi:hypothetical protein
VLIKIFVSEVEANSKTMHFAGTLHNNEVCHWECSAEMLYLLLPMMGL